MSTVPWAAVAEDASNGIAENEHTQEASMAEGFKSQVYSIEEIFFNDFDDGTLQGWGTRDNSVLSTEYSHSGDYSIKVNDNKAGGDMAECYKIFSPLSKGMLNFWAYIPSGNTYGLAIALTDQDSWHKHPNHRFFMNIDPRTGAIKYYHNDEYHDFPTPASISFDQWNELSIKWDLVKNQFELTINEIDHGIGYQRMSGGDIQQLIFMSNSWSGVGIYGYFDDIALNELKSPSITTTTPTPTPTPSSEIEALYQDKDDNGIWIEIYGPREPPLNSKVDYVVFITLAETERKSAEGNGNIYDMFESAVYVAYPDDYVNTYPGDELLSKILYENEERWYSQNIAEGLEKHEGGMKVVNILMSVACRIPSLWEVISSQMLPSDAVPPENSVFFDDNTHDTLVVPFSCTGGVEEKKINAPNNLRHVGPDNAYCLVVPTEFTEARPTDLHFFIAVKKGEGLGQGFTYRHTKDIVIRIKPRSETGNSITGEFISEDPNPTVPEEKTPGFEAVFAIAGLLAVAYFLRKRE